MNTTAIVELKEAASGLFTDAEIEAMIAADAEQSKPREIATAALVADFATVIDVECDPTILAILNSIDIDLPANRMHGSYDRELSEQLSTYTERTRSVDNRVWDLLPPGTAPQSGDEIEDEGVWRPRWVLADCTRRYDRAVFKRIEAQKAFDANPTDKALKALDQARENQLEALKASDDETIHERDRVDDWRAGDGREEYNAGRRKVRDHANQDLSRMTEDEKAARKREQGRIRNQRKRERERIMQEAKAA